MLMLIFHLGGEEEVGIFCGTKNSLTLLEFLLWHYV